LYKIVAKESAKPNALFVNTELAITVLYYFRLLTKMLEGSKMLGESFVTFNETAKDTKMQRAFFLSKSRFDLVVCAFCFLRRPSRRALTHSGAPTV